MFNNLVKQQKLILDNLKNCLVPMKCNLTQQTNRVFKQTILKRICNSNFTFQTKVNHFYNNIIL